MARFTRSITTVDSHTVGESTRLVTGGLPLIEGETIVEKMAYAREHLPWVPGLLLNEPRGHHDMFGAVLVPPCSQGADFGVIFMDNKGYDTMCGHATIGVVTTLLETGMFEMREPETLLKLDTPAGLVNTYARVEGGRVVEVSLENIPAFVYRRGVALALPDTGEFTVDLAFGGNFFVFADARQLGIELVPASADRLAELGTRIVAAANEKVTARHPELPHIDRITDMRFYVEPGGEGADSRNVVIFGDRMVDRSPCGTGTCAEVALRHARGLLKTGESFVTESIIGTRFRGEAVSETRVGDFPSVVPRVTGSAYITGFNRFVLDAEDPFPAGFKLG